jgi:AcrR family transcriptional regulator
MKDNDLETREKILKKTLELIRSEKDYSKITVRRIVSYAGVSLSAVNYHFGSKKELIDETVRRPIIEFLASNSMPDDAYADDPIKRLKELMKLPARYLAENPNVSRISILSDMTEPAGNDLTMQTLAFLMPTARRALPGLGEKEAALKVWELISLVQTAFLRSMQFASLTGLDYFDGKSRGKFIDNYINNMVKNKEGNSNV